MKKKFLLFPGLISCCFLGGCIANQSLDTMSSAETNISNLWRISKGMSQCQVLQIMHKPFDYETFQFDEDIYDVWFYITRVTGLGQSRLVPQNLTPLTFKNGVLVDVGYVYYNYLVKEEQIRAKTAATVQPAQTPQSKELEDRELEKVLQTPPNNQKKPTSPAKNQAPAPTNPAPTNPAPSTPPAAPAPKKTTPSAPVQPQSQPAPPSNPKGGTAPQNQLPGRPSPQTPQPPNQLPGEPIRPTTPVTAPPKTSSMTSMCSRPKNISIQPEKDLPGEEEENSSSGPGGQKWDEEDERMQEEESEQNFDYW